MRLYAVSDAGDEDLEYREGLRDAVEAAIDSSLQVIERGEEAVVRLPAALLAQARHAAHKAVGLDVVVRRYVAGYSTLSDEFMREAGERGLTLDSSTLHRVQRELAAFFDRIVAAVSSEYEQEAKRVLRSASERRADRVKRLLAGEPIDTANLGYNFDAWHLGLVAEGSGAEEALRGLDQCLDCRLLVVAAGRVLWAWTASRRKVEAHEFVGHLAGIAQTGAFFAVGEPAAGISGWRQTHRQARSAFGAVACRRYPVTRYSEVALVTSILRDRDLTAYLTGTYIRPLAGDRDDGATMRETLRAYFAAGRNVSSAAAAIGVSRQTITSRLAVIEERLGRPLQACAGELEVAISLASVEHANSSSR